MSGRDLRDICQHAERHWASKVPEACYNEMSVRIHILICQSKRAINCPRLNFICSLRLNFGSISTLQLIRGQVGEPSTHGLPPIQEYMDCAQKRQQTVLRQRDEGQAIMGDAGNTGPRMKKWLSVMV